MGDKTSFARPSHILGILQKINLCHKHYTLIPDLEKMIQKMLLNSFILFLLETKSNFRHAESSYRGDYDVYNILTNLDASKEWHTVVPICVPWRLPWPIDYNVEIPVYWWG